MFETVLSLTAASLLLFISVYAVVKGRGMKNVALSFTALLLAAIEVLDYALLHASRDPVILERTAIFIESLLPAAFALFSLSYARRGSIGSLAVFWRAFALSTVLFPVSTLVFPAADFFFSPDLLTERMLFLGTAGYWFYIGMLLYLTVGLMNLETTFSAASRSDREKIKFEYIGMTGILAVLIFYFSQGLLYRSINMNLVPVRSGVFIVASALVVYSKLFRGNGVKVAVSRYIVYRSVTLTLIGSYLLVLGLTGEGMRYFGVSFSRDITIFLAFTTGFLMLFVLVSARLRRRMKVFINKNFFAHKHDYRKEWLGFTERLASCRSFAEVQDAILNTYRGTFGLSGASLYLISGGRERYALAASQSMEPGAAELMADAGLISYFLERDRVFNPCDGEYAPRGDEVLFINQVRPTAIVPLTANGSVEGFVVFEAQLASEEYIYEDYDLMKAIARQAALSVMNFRLTEEITETREIAAAGRISSFVMHDLKNLASTFALTLNNAEDNIRDPEFQDDMVLSIRNALARVNGLIRKLNSVGKDTLHKEIADVDVIAGDVVDGFTKSGMAPRIVYRGAHALSAVDVEEMKSVILNLILNAFDALGDGDRGAAGLVEVEAGSDDNKVFVRVRDNGCGMTRDFMDNHLFKPFRTTKKKGFGIGLYQCRQIIDAHGGRCLVESRVGEGSVFTVWLPLAEEPGALCNSKL